MSVIWLIEACRDGRQPIAEALMGNFPVRAFASFSSFQKLIKIQKTTKPDLLVVDLDSCDATLPHVRDICDYYVPDQKMIFIGSYSGKDAAGASIVAKSEDSWELVCAVANMLAEGSTAKPESVLRYRDLVLDVSRFTWQLLPEGNHESLPPKEARILRLLMERAGACLSRAEIKQDIWPDVSVSSRTIDSHVSRLRKRLASAEAQIESVYGGGYQLK